MLQMRIRKIKWRETGTSRRQSEVHQEEIHQVTVKGAEQEK